MVIISIFIVLFLSQTGRVSFTEEGDNTTGPTQSFDIDQSGFASQSIAEPDNNDIELVSDNIIIASLGDPSQTTDFITVYTDAISSKMLSEAYKCNDQPLPITYSNYSNQSYLSFYIKSIDTGEVVARSLNNESFSQKASYQSYEAPCVNYGSNYQIVLHKHPRELNNISEFGTDTKTFNFKI